MSDTSPPLLLSPRDAARTLAVCEKSLWNFSQPRGPIPVIRIGRSCRYSIDDLRDFVEQQKQSGSTERA